MLHSQLPGDSCLLQPARTVSYCNVIVFVPLNNEQLTVQSISEFATDPQRLYSIPYDQIARGGSRRLSLASNRHLCWIYARSFVLIRKQPGAVWATQWSGSVGTDACARRPGLKSEPDVTQPSSSDIWDEHRLATSHKQTEHILSLRRNVYNSSRKCNCKFERKQVLSVVGRTALINRCMSAYVQCPPVVEIWISKWSGFVRTRTTSLIPWLICITCRTSSSFC